jgi:hypothetical protein
MFCYTLQMVHKTKAQQQKYQYYSLNALIMAYFFHKCTTIIIALDRHARSSELRLCLHPRESFLRIGLED